MPELISQFFIDVNSIPHTFAGFVQLSFLGGIYGYILFYASNMIKDGSELLLLVPALAGVVGSIVLPILGAVPDGAIVIFSGLGENAQEEVSVGVGALAGSTIMLLTVPWMLAVIAGRVGMVNGEPQYTKPKGWAKGQKWAKLTTENSLWNTGVRCGPAIRKSAVLMLVTLIPYFIVQIPAALNSCIWEAEKKDCRTPQWASIVGAVLATLLFCFYLWYQVQMADDDEVKEDRIDEIRKNALRKHLVSIRGLVFTRLRENGGGHDSTVPFDANDERFRKVIRSFFNEFDADHSGFIERNEFNELLHKLGEKPSDQQLDDLIKTADKNGDGHICFNEFCEAIVAMSEDGYFEKTIRDDKHSSARIDALKRDIGEKIPLSSAEVRPVKDDVEQMEEEEAEESDVEEEATEMPEDLAHLSPAEQQKRILYRSFMLMGLGVATVLIFSDPMVEVMTVMGEHTGIKSFYIAFILAPLASNASEVIAAYSYALKKTEKTMTISFSSLIGAACMNNSFCLSLFLFLIYFRNLEWTFTAETISIVVIEIVMFFVAIRRVHPSWTALAVLALFPLSICLVAGLEYIGLD